MEEREKAHINSNIFDLLQNLEYNSLITAFLQQNGQIDRADVEAMNVIHRIEGNSAAVRKLLEILQGRQGAYASLLGVTRELRQTGAAAILESLIGVSGSPNFRFQKYSKLPAGLEDFLQKAATKNKSSSSICIISALDTRITSEKLGENLEAYSKIYEFEEFLAMISVRRGINWSIEQWHFVRIPGFHQVKEVVNDLLIKKVKKVRLVIVTEIEHEKSLRKLTSEETSWRKKVQIIVDLVDWEDLTLAHKHEVKRRLEQQLEIGFAAKEADDATLARTLRGTVLIDLINGNELKLFRETLPGELSYYVGRRLLPRHFISLKIFEQTCPDIFVFTGMERFELSRLAKNQMTDGSGSQTSRQGRLTVRHMILEREDHLDKVCDKTSEPVHLLHYEKGKLKWMKSSGGGVGTLQKCVEQVGEHLGEEEFIRNLNQASNLPICISDSPGMGKSVLLTKVGRRLRELYPERKVFYLVLSEFVVKVKQLGMLMDKKASIQKILGETICESPVGQLVLNHVLHLKSKTDNVVIVELLLDGFDEVDFADFGLAHELLKIMVGSFAAIRVWVTSRPHLLHELERNLNTLGYNIQAFDGQDQVRFLTSFWSRRNADKLDPVKLERFAGDCLKILNSRMSSSNKQQRDEDIAGIPLQCLLIGEVYEEEAINLGGLDSGQSLSSSSSSVPVIHFNSITGLYKCLIATKFQKYLTVHMKRDFGGADALMDMHVRLSLELIFPEEAKKLSSRFGNVQMEEILKIGILEDSTAACPTSAVPPRFIHRTFAEYFVAWFVVERLVSSGHWEVDLNDLYFTRVLASKDVHCRLFVRRYEVRVGVKSFEFSQPVITYFFNCLLSDFQEVGLPTPVFQEPFQECVGKILQASMTSDLIQIFRLFHAIPGMASQSGSIFNDEFLLIALNKSGLELIRLAFTHYEEHHRQEYELGFQAAALREAVNRGEFSIVEYLLKEKQWMGVLGSAPEGTKGLLIDCVDSSRGDADEVINQKIQVIRMLLDINPKLLGEKNVEGRTALLSRDVHVRLLVQLVGLGVDMTPWDEEQKLFFQLAIARNTLPGEDIHTILLSIPEEKLRVLVRHTTRLGETTLMNLVKFDWFHPASQTLELLKDMELDFNLLNASGESALAVGTRSGIKAVTLERLIQLGAGIHWRGRKGESLLHLAAASGNLEALGLLLDEHEFPVNLEDEDGLTGLDYAMRSKYASSFEAGAVLHQRNGKYKDVVNAEGHSWIHVAAKEGSLNSLKLLLHLGVNVNGRDNEGNSPLHLGVIKFKSMKPYYWITRLLLEGNADPSLVNKKGENPLQAALKNVSEDVVSSIEAIRLLVDKTVNMEWTPLYASLGLCLVTREGMSVNDEEFQSLAETFLGHGGNINHRDDDGIPLIHLALDRRNDRAFYFLMGKGADPNSAGKWAEAPAAIHVAARRRDEDMGYETIKCLIENGADVFVQNGSGAVFLHIYLSGYFKPSPSEFHSLVEYLDGKELLELFNIPAGKNYKGGTPLQLAVLYLELEERTLSLLHSTNLVSFNQVDDNGDTILTYAVWGKMRLPLLSYLIDCCGANWKLVNKYGNSLLHISARDGRSDCLKFFLDLGGLDVDGVDQNGNTPLHWAACDKQKNRGLEKCKLLLEKGANISILNNEGNHPLAILLKRCPGTDKKAVLQILGITDDMGDPSENTSCCPTLQQS